MFLTEGVNLSGANTEGVFGAMKKIKIENLSVDENLVELPLKTFGKILAGLLIN